MSAVLPGPAQQAYNSVFDVERLLANLAAAHPRVARLVQLPETTAQPPMMPADPPHPQQPLRSHALHISTDFGAGRDAILLTGGVHGAEWGSCEILLGLARDLLDANEQQSGLAYEGRAHHRGVPAASAVFTAQALQQLLAERDVLVFPLVNPDGRHYSQTSAGTSEVDWRKNRRPIVVNGRQAGIGVDVNRNFDFAYGLQLYAAPPDASKTPTDKVYQGPGPESEAETRNVVWLLDTFPVGWFVDVHSPGLSMCYPWNHDDSQSGDSTMNFRTAPPGSFGVPGAPTPSTPNYREFLAINDRDRMVQLAERFVKVASLVAGRTYDARPAYFHTPLPATSHDYAYSRHLALPPRGHKVLAFLCEWGNMHAHPPWAEMQQILPEVVAGLLAFCIETTTPQPP